MNIDDKTNPAVPQPTFSPHATGLPPNYQQHQNPHPQQPHPQVQYIQQPPQVQYVQTPYQYGQQPPQIQYVQVPPQQYVHQPVVVVQRSRGGSFVLLNSAMIAMFAFSDGVSQQNMDKLFPGNREAFSEACTRQSRVTYLYFHCVLPPIPSPTTNMAPNQHILLEDMEETSDEIYETIEEARRFAGEKCWEAYFSYEKPGHFKQIKEYLWQLDDYDADGFLSHMITNNYLDITRYLLDLGADLRRITCDQVLTEWSPDNSAAMLQLLADFGMNLSTKRRISYRKSESPILRNKEVLDWLLDQGVDINRGSNNILYEPTGKDSGCRDNTVEVLNKAAEYGDIELFSYLVFCGAKPSQGNALHEVSWCDDPHRGVAIATYLIKTQHMNINASSASGSLNTIFNRRHNFGSLSPLEAAVLYSDSASAAISVAKLLLENRAVLGRAVRIAIEEKLFQGLRLVLESGADPTEILHDAILENYFKGVKVCLEYGGDVVRGYLE
ncbi:hypothetical protein G7Y89_g6641 [Cudoniella acicularis]|uniref:Uncharacterized protein n=1 Tax=Cudoniella acicularis TaxID=354080 RepID=A0A8H4RK36_9HELO|nr:hypothetical protein G7Y89_g6641 [Cudoniella acicularis]